MACLELISEYSSYYQKPLNYKPYLSCSIHDFTLILVISEFQSFAECILDCWVITLNKATINKLNRQ